MTAKANKANKANKAAGTVKAVKAVKAVKKPKRPGEILDKHKPQIAKIAKHKDAIAEHERAFARLNAEHERDLKLHAKHKHAPMTGLKIEEMTAAQKFLRAQQDHGWRDLSGQAHVARAAKKLNDAWAAIHGKLYTPKSETYKARVQAMNQHRAAAHTRAALMYDEQAKLWKM